MMRAVRNKEVFALLKIRNVGWLSKKSQLQIRTGQHWSLGCDDVILALKGYAFFTIHSAELCRWEKER